eukprot:1493913-Lingulodinium_polyedra.AAC.1
MLSPKSRPCSDHPPGGRQRQQATVAPVFSRGFCPPSRGILKYMLRISLDRANRGGMTPAHVRGSLTS